MGEVIHRGLVSPNMICLTAFGFCPNFWDDFHTNSCLCLYLCTTQQRYNIGHNWDEQKLIKIPCHRQIVREDLWWQNAILDGSSTVRYKLLSYKICKNIKEKILCEYLRFRHWTISNSLAESFASNSFGPRSHRRQKINFRREMFIFLQAYSLENIY